MAEIIINQLNKYYGSNHILKGITFEVYEGDKVGLLGKNGTGKTTLFKILKGNEPFDSGNVLIQRDRKIEVLDQIPDYPESFTVSHVIKTAFDRALEIQDEMKRIEALMQQCPESNCLRKYGILQTEFEALGGYTMDSSIERVCNGLGIGEELMNKAFFNLSGGEKTRVNLARMLLRSADILLLDEPTNHLDINAIQWLEGFVEQYKGTVLIISHDRFFLDSTVSRIIEIVDGKAEFYAGNYSYYVREKEDRFLKQQEQYEQQHKKIEQLERAAKRMHQWAQSADNPKLHRRAFAMEKRIERMEKIEKPKEDNKYNGEFVEKSFSGKEVVLFDCVSKRFGEKVILSNVSLSVTRNERISIIGENGTGKSTILELITGQEESDGGRVRVGDSIKYAYLEQVITFYNPDFSVLETVRYELEVSEEKARRALAPFNFKGKDVLKKVDSLSGGEKSRLKLCLLMQDDCNLLLLDEPTNHLDLASKEWIEKSVREFKGTVIFVSHDRYFINCFAERIWEIKDGEIIDFKGDYKRYCEWKHREDTKAIKEKTTKTKKPSYPDKNGEHNKNREHSANKGEKDRLEAKIEELDTHIKVLDKKMEEISFDYKELVSLMNEREELNQELDLLYQKWIEM